MMSTSADGEVVGVHGVSVMRSGNLLLDGIDWRVGAGERWVPHEDVRPSLPLDAFHDEAARERSAGR